MSWTDERVETMKTMWLAGYSSSQIAAALGDVSRNGVIGRLNRLGLLGTARPKALTGSHLAPSAKRGGADTKSVRNRQLNAQLRVAPVVVVDQAHRVGKTETRRVFASEMAPTAELLGLGAHACKWPIGHPGADGFGFCGRGATGTYCNEHARVAYLPKPPRDKTFADGRKLPLWATR